jgi:hypothetical protein
MFNSTYVGNTATVDEGGGTYEDTTASNYANDTFFGNVAGTQGGGMYLDSTLATITDSTIDGNSAAYAGGGGIHNHVGCLLDGDIVAGNYVTGTPGTGNDLNGVFIKTSTDNIIGDGSNQTGFTAGEVGGNFTGTTLSPINPMLGTLSDNGGPTETQIPGPTSLAIGNNADFPVLDASANDVTLWDQTGLNLRPQSQGYDIGAYQTGGAPVVITPTLSVADSSVTAPVTGSTTISFTVTLSAPAPVAFTVTYSTIGQTASSQNGDYMGFTNRVSVTFPANTTSFVLPVTIVKRVAGHGSYPKHFEFVIDSVSTPDITIAVGNAEGTIN